MDFCFFDQPGQWPERNKKKKQPPPGSLSGDLHSISNALLYPAPLSPRYCTAPPTKWKKSKLSKQIQQSEDTEYTSHKVAL